MVSAAVLRTLCELRDGMGLQEWDLLVSAIQVEDLGNGELARIDPKRQMMAALVTIASRRPEADVRWSCIHEMLHLRMDDQRAALLAAISDLDGAIQAQVLARYDDAEERAVVALAKWATGHSATEVRAVTAKEWEEHGRSGA